MARHKPAGIGIYIKPENRGKYTARAKAHGNTVQEQARKDLADPDVSPEIKKEANFARNAAKWDHSGARPSGIEYGTKRRKRARQG